VTEDGPAHPSVGGERLSATFYDRPVLQVAQDLLGCVIEHDRVTVRLVEVEAYDGERDPGSHAYRGRTPRTAVMFGPPGGLYVYFTYGMHYCANLVCGPPGRASAVLLRAGAVVAGEDLARARRTAATHRTIAARDLARGPARLATCLAFGRAQNGVLTTAPQSPVTVRRGAGPIGTVAVGPRVGVSGPGGDGAEFPWRYWLEGDRHVSAYRPGGFRRTRT